MNRKKGFTLIELLVVIAIIGILSSVVLASLNSARQKARDAKRVADIKQVQLALEMFYNDNGHYPDDANAADVLDGTGGYIPKMPIDPGTAGSDYLYVSTGSGTTDSCSSYHLGATLENTNSVPDSDGDTDTSSLVENADSCGGEGFDGSDTAGLVYDVTP